MKFAKALAHGCACIIAINSAFLQTTSATAASFTVLHSFTGGDGANPEAGLILDNSHNLYGTAELGGAKNVGVIFKIAEDGSSSVLYSFKGKGDGDIPISDILAGADGNLYSTTKLGGITTCDDGKGCGVVFRLKSDGTLNTLHKFAGGTDGAFAHAGLVQDDSGNLYGTTSEGGDPNCLVDDEPVGCGTIYRIAPDGTETILHNFEGGSDGRVVYGGLMLDGAGTLYGTARVGGGSACGGSGCGIVFGLSSSGKYTVLHVFKGGKDGANPEAGLLLAADGNLYGTTSSGGNSKCFGDGCGTVFKLTPEGKTSIVYKFSGNSDGASPLGALIADKAGNLYGTTGGGGGDCGCGTVFKLAPDGTETVLHKFTGGSDGAYPDGRLLVDAKGNVYGTTSAAGDGDSGTVFKIKQ